MKYLPRVMAIVFIALFLVIAAQAEASDSYVFTVDGVEYTAIKVVGSGPTVHYETPDVNPQSAFTDRNVWTGNGSENLPCEGGIHWIDNKNVLTVSHCYQGEATPPTTSTSTTSTTRPPPTTTSTTIPSSTTTTTVQVTTTTVSPTTTTTVAPTTTSTLEPTTTTVPYSGTTVPPDTSTTQPVLCGKNGDAPCGGVQTGTGTSGADEQSGPTWPWVLIVGGFTALGWLFYGLIKALLKGRWEEQ